MVWHEVDYYFHSSLVCAADQSLELLHSFLHVNSKVGIDVVVVGYGIWRSSLTFYHCRMLTWNAVSRIICLRSVANHSGVPNVCYTFFLYLLQFRRREIIEFSTTVLPYGAVWLSGCVAVAIETW